MEDLISSINQAIQNLQSANLTEDQERYAESVLKAVDSDIYDLIDWIENPEEE